MANLEQIVSRKAENDTKWKEAQQAERENTTAMQDAGITEITSNPEAYAPGAGRSHAGLGHPCL